MEGLYKVLVVTMWFINLKSTVIYTTICCFYSPTLYKREYGIFNEAVN